MSKIVQIAILDFNVNEALKKGLDIKDEQIMQKSETLEHSFQKYLNSVYTFI